MIGNFSTRSVTKPSAMRRLYRSVLFWLVFLWACCEMVGVAVAAEGTARPTSREFDPFDILAWEVLAGVEASDDATFPKEGRDDARIRIAVWPFSAEQTPLPASLANEYNDRLLVSLLSQGGSRHRFIAREALSAVVKEIDESSSRDAELDGLLAALVERAKADVLIVGKLRRTSRDAVVLSYEAVRVSDGTILAATSHQRLPIDPAEVELAARPKAPAPSAKPATPSPWDKYLSVRAPDTSTSTHGLASRDENIAAVQADLLDLGYDPGPVDGILGPRTRAAIRAYQDDAHLPVDGLVSASLVVSLRKDVAVHQGYAAKPERVRAGPTLTEPVVVRPMQPVIHGADGTYCREYQKNVSIGGAVQRSYGRACLQADGTWKIVR